MSQMLYNQDDIKKWWHQFHSTDIGPNKTIRIVEFIGEKVYTLKEQFNNYSDFIKHISLNYGKYGTNYGIAASASEFTYVEDRGPSLSTISNTKSIIIDVDCYDSATSKNKVITALLNPEWQKMLLIQAFSVIFAHFHNNGIKIPFPKSVGVTGSGLQLRLDFDKDLNKSEIELIFQLLRKYALDKRVEVIMFNPLGSVANVALEFDVTSFDASHVQRVLGTRHPKHGVMSGFIDLTRNEMVDFARDQYSSIEERFLDSNERIKFIEKTGKIINILNYAATHTPETFNSSELIDFARAEIASAPRAERNGIRPSEFEILTQLNNGKGLYLLNLEKVRDTSKVTLFKCPFHEGDKHSSFAYYKNDGPNSFDIAIDFHDNKKYNFIELYAALNNISKAHAIKEIVDLTGIKVSATSKKDIKRLEAGEEAGHAISKINTEDYVYYRLANKNKTCVIRHIKTGKPYVFDGVKALARQVLKDQLGVEVVDRDFLDEFMEALEANILVDGFEVFKPGAEPVFKENGISMVNTWVPTDNYKLAHKKAEELRKALGEDKIDLEKAIRLIEHDTPNIAVFIRQLVQYGDLEWLVNWLAMTVQFKITPTVPVVHGVYGAGKNAFMENIIAWYLGDETVNVVNTEAITKQFNAFMSNSSLILVDEGNFHSKQGAAATDALKLLSGNSKISIEKKGIDSYTVDRTFNFMSFSNKNVPALINAMERRFSFFRNTITLQQTCQVLGYSSIAEFLEKVQEELPEFFGIVLNIKLKDEWTNMNVKEGSFWRVTFNGHPFGKLLIHLLEGSWESLSLQIIENASDDAVVSNAVSIVENLKKTFEKDGMLPLTLVNRFMNSLGYKSKISIAEFARQNMLTEAIQQKIIKSNVYIKLDLKKLWNLIQGENVIVKYFVDKVPGFKEFYEKHKKEFMIPELTTELISKFLMIQDLQENNNVDLETADIIEDSSMNSVENSVADVPSLSSQTEPKTDIKEEPGGKIDLSKLSPDVPDIPGINDTVEMTTVKQLNTQDIIPKLDLPDLDIPI